MNLSTSSQDDAEQELRRHYSRPANLTLLYTKAISKLKRSVPKDRWVDFKVAAQEIVHGQYTALVKQIRAGRITDLSLPALICKLESFVCKKAEHYGKPSCNRERLVARTVQLSDEQNQLPVLMEAFHHQDKAYTYLCEWLKLDLTSRTVLRRMLDFEYDKDTLAGELNVSSKEVQQKRDYLKKRIKALEQQETLVERLERVPD